MTPAAASDPGAWFRQGRYAEVRAHCDAVLASGPGNPAARYLRAQVDLIQGRLPEAWAGYECRFDIPDWPARRPPIPPWHGEPLPGQTLVLTMEGGFGDLFQFARFMPAAVAMAGRVVTDLPTGVAWLFAAEPSRFGQVLGVGERVDAVHRHCTIMSLPAVLGARLEQLPTAPYLAAEPADVGRWARRLDDGSGCVRVGLVWRAGAEGDPARSLPLDALAPLAGVPGVRLISLQRQPTADEQQQLAGLGAAWFDDLDAGPDLFRDTAAILAGLDLVVSVDTAVAHLAGAMGRPVWVALPRYPDWRWLLDRPDSPWYPTMRLFRQPSPGAWSPVVSAVAAAMASALRTLAR